MLPKEGYTGGFLTLQTPTFQRVYDNPRLSAKTDPQRRNGTGWQPPPSASLINRPFPISLRDLAQLDDNVIRERPDLRLFIRVRKGGI